MGLRDLTESDGEALLRFAVMSSFPPGWRVSAEDRHSDHLRRWLDDWDDELGVGWQEDGRLIGAAWARRVSPVLVRDAETGQPLPELILGVERNMRRRSVGRRLLTAVQARAARDGTALAAKVRLGNRAAVGLATAAGFVPCGSLPEGRRVLVWRPESANAGPESEAA
jgi:GNAT superfamily N-acetyltransferase